ncbi:lysophospholipid acyltransferase family protein [Dermacoccaceae bacterium W4C1]
MELVYRPIIQTALGMFAAQGLRFDIRGEEHYPRTGGAVVVMNHLSYFDYTYAGIPAHHRGRRLVRWMAKKEIFDQPVAGTLMRNMKHIPVDRKAGVAAYQEAVAALQRGELVGVFPETTISRSFELRDFKSGAARMAQAAGVPMIPVVAWGNQRVWTKDLPKNLGRKKIEILMEVAAPITVTPDADVNATTTALREQMSQMLHRLQDEYPTLPESEQAYVPARLGGSAPTPQQAAEIEAEEAKKRAARKAKKG